jgi:hypothetical protein
MGHGTEETAATTIKCVQASAGYNVASEMATECRDPTPDNVKPMVNGLLLGTRTVKVRVDDRSYIMSCCARIINC